MCSMHVIWKCVCCTSLWVGCNPEQYLTNQGVGYVQSEQISLLTFDCKTSFRGQRYQSLGGHVRFVDFGLLCIGAFHFVHSVRDGAEPAHYNVIGANRIFVTADACFHTENVCFIAGNVGYTVIVCLLGSSLWDHWQLTPKTCHLAAYNILIFAQSTTLGNNTAQRCLRAIRKHHSSHVLV